MIQQEEKEKRGCLFIGLIVLGTIAISVGLTIWIMTQYIFPKQFEPVELSGKEQQKLEQKLKAFEGLESTQSLSNQSGTSGELQPEKYSEVGADRRIELTERELNGMLAKNTDLAQRLAIDLSDSLASGKLLVPLDPDFPIMGGKTLKLSAGMELAFRHDKPIVVLKGVSVMGVPIPNAWLGNLKNVDLVREFGGSEGFWKSFSDGVENIEVTEGKLVIQLKE
ncbi:MAG: hypothetical protein KTR18_09640 [Acidiferrobacterales bacterium]|nr:hypothetical protein [Acidiferrobacterales bacterium]